MSSDFSSEMSNVSEGITANIIPFSQQEKPLMDSKTITEDLKQDRRPTKEHLKNNGIDLYNKSYKKNVNPKKNVKTLTTYERLFKYKKEIDLKIDTKRLEIQKRETEKCTFVPRINRQNKRARSLEEYLNDIQIFEKKKENKLIHKRNEKREEVFNYAPSISPRSRRIASNSPSRKKIQRHCLAQPSSFCFSFAPKISKNSKLLVNRQTENSNLFLNKKITDNSNRFSPESHRKERNRRNYISYFRKELENICSYYNLNNSNMVNYYQYKKILEKMRLTTKRNFEDRTVVLNLWEEISQRKGKVLVSHLKYKIVELIETCLKDSNSLEKCCNDEHVPSKYSKLFNNRLSIRKKFKFFPSIELLAPGVHKSNTTSVRRRGRLNAVIGEQLIDHVLSVAPTHLNISTKSSDFEYENYTSPHNRLPYLYVEDDF